MLKVSADKTIFIFGQKTFALFATLNTIELCQTGFRRRQRRMPVAVKCLQSAAGGFQL